MKAFESAGSGVAGGVEFAYVEYYNLAETYLSFVVEADKLLVNGVSAVSGTEREYAFSFCGYAIVYNIGDTASFCHCAFYNRFGNLDIDFFLTAQGGHFHLVFRGVIAFGHAVEFDKFAKIRSHIIYWFKRAFSLVSNRLEHGRIILCKGSVDFCENVLKYIN